MEPSTDMPAAALTHLRELVTRHHVTYAVASDIAVVEDKLRAVGFTIELAATHDHPKHAPSPGCDECFPVARALHEILAGVIPADFRPSYFEVHESRLSLRFSPGRDSRPELTASVEIIHRDGADRAIDDCEMRCRDEIVARLRAIGVREGSWPGSR